MGQRQLLSSSPEAVVGMDKSEFTRTPSAARGDHEEKLTEESMEPLHIYQFSISITKCLVVGLGLLLVSRASSCEDKLNTGKK